MLVVGWCFGLLFGVWVWLCALVLVPVCGACGEGVVVGLLDCAVLCWLLLGVLVVISLWVFCWLLFGCCVDEFGFRFGNCLFVAD